MASAQAQKHVTHNEALLRLDTLVQLAVIARTLAAAPATPAEGDRYLVAAGATGDWAGHGGDLAAWQNGAWVFATPQTGWRMWVAAEDKLLVLTATGWRDANAVTDLQNLASLGVNAAADATNRLSVAAPAALFNHAGTDMRLKINKSAAAATASMLFQNGFAGRAELGLAGDDDFRVKVSADGSSWTDAIVIDKATGIVSLPTTPGGQLPDGNRGDVSVSNSGAIWTVNTASISSGKLGGDVSAAGKAMLTAGSAAAQTALLDAATPSAKGLMSPNDKAKSDGAATRAALAAMPTAAGLVALTEAGRDGWFKWDAGVLVATHQADIRQGIYVPPSAAANGAWVRQFTGPLQAEWFGAVADFAGGTGTDNTAAVQGAITMALLLGGHEIRFGAGRFYFPSITSLDPGAGSLAFIGLRDQTVLHFEEGTAGSKRYLFKNTTNTAKGGLTFRDLCFQGTLATSARRAGNPLWLDYYKRVNIENCRFTNIAGEAMDFHYCSQFRCVGSDFEDIAADCIRARDCPDTMVSGNRIKRNGDDSIAIHVTPWSYSSFRPTRRRIDIHNNIVVNGGAIKVIGPKVTRITNNVLGLINQAHGIIVQDSSPEGGVAFHDIEISGNTINDVVNVSTGTAAQATAYISIAATAAMTPRGATATNGTIPGDYDATGATFIKPWDWYETDSTDATKAVPFPARIVVARNTLGRTLKAAAAFSDYGHGTSLFQGVASDPAVGETTLFPTNGVWGGSYPGFVGLAINDNQIEDCEYGVGLPTATSDHSYRNCQVMRNRMLNIKNYGVICQGAYDIDMTIAHNVIDMDPYCRNANSNVNGSFAADGLPWGISGGSAKGVRIFDNTFAHCCVPVKLNSPGSNHVDRNIIRCGTPAAVGYNAGNKGIGNIPVNDNWVYEIGDADPTSGTYRQYAQKLLQFSSSMPSTGWYPAGYFVRSTATAQLGWMRLTTGSSHTLNTDWQAVPAAAYTPANIADSALLHGQDFGNDVQNGLFLKGDVGFSKGGSWQIVSDAANALTGSYCARNSAASGVTEQLYPIATTADQKECVPGDVVYAEALLKCSAGATLSRLDITVDWFDKDNVYISSVAGNNLTSAATSYTLSSCTATAPANAYRYRITVRCQVTVGTVYVGRVAMYKKRDPLQLLAGVTQAGRDIMTAADAAAQRTALGLGSAATQASSAFEAAGAVAAHAAAGDPHPQYLTQTEGDGRYALAGSGGTGDVTGPASSDDKALVRFSGTGGKTIQNSTVLLNDDGSLRLPAVASPAAPAGATLNLFSSDVGGRQMLGARSSYGTAVAMQPLLARNKVGLWNPPGNATTLPAIFAIAAPVALGTATARNVAATNLFTRMRRLGYVSSATAGSLAGHYGTASQFTIGDGTSQGGFLTIIRYGVSDAATVAGARMFVGLRNATAAPTNVEPNTLTNAIGLAQLSTSGNLQIVYGGSAAQTPIDLGANFPAGTLSADPYELVLYAPVNNQVVSYRVERLSTGAVASGTLTGTIGTALPAASTFLNVTLWRTNNATALAVGIDITSVYVETDA
jgi:hypothetical protein